MVGCNIFNTTLGHLLWRLYNQRQYLFKPANRCLQSDPAVDNRTSIVERRFLLKIVISMFVFVFVALFVSLFGMLNTT